MLAADNLKILFFCSPLDVLQKSCTLSLKLFTSQGKHTDSILGVEYDSQGDVFMKSLRYLVFALVLVAASCSSPTTLVKVPKKIPALPGGVTLSYANQTIGSGQTAFKLTDGRAVVGDATAAFTAVLTKSKMAADKGAITYKSSDEAVATINASSGEVTVVAGGTTTITATKAETAGKFAQSIASYELTVRDQKIEFKSPNKAVEADGDPKVTNAATLIDTLAKGTGAISYQSSDTRKATVSSSTGEVTGKAVGTTDITATIAAVNGKYKEQTATYTMTVS